MSPRKKTSHHSKIFIGMIVGTAAGLIVQFIENLMTLPSPNVCFEEIAFE